MAVRAPSHAGNWYESDGDTLSDQLDAFIDAATAATAATAPARALIVPHAGYSYSGSTAAFGYKAVDPSTITRVFLLGPSHHWFTRQCALSPAAVYRTVLGDVPLDAAVYAELRASGHFVTASKAVDDAEHSLEMHLPYLVKRFAGRPFTLVPIIVGALTPASEELYGRLLSDYLDDPQNLFVISSDFCHFGKRFDFVRRPFLPDGPAHASIEALDRLGMGLIEEGDPAAFTAYLATHGNTICGRHPIGVLLHAQRACRTRFTTRFTRYAQSSRATSAQAGDSSVSYAAAVCVADAAQARP